MQPAFRTGLCYVLAILVIVDPILVEQWIVRGQEAGSRRSAERGLQKEAAGKLTQADLKRMADDMERTFKALEAAAREIPRDSFDPKAVVDKVGKDPVKLFEWVRDNTYWAPYQGCLRGSTGVLMDRLGNSLDRSLLLAELLREAGHKVRLVRGELSEKQAQTLLAKIRPVPKNPVPVTARADQKAIQELLEKYAKQYTLNATELRKNLERTSLHLAKLAEQAAQRVADQVPIITRAVGTPSATKKVELEKAELKRDLASLRDHWWVQREDSGQWISFDPILPDAVPNGTYGEPTQEIDAADQAARFKLDSKFCHEIRIRVLIEQWRDGQLYVKEVMKHTLRPSELIGKRIALNHIPVNWPRELNLVYEKEGLKKLNATILAQNEWLPVLTIGGEHLTQSSFGDTGEIYTDGPNALTAKFGRAVAQFDPFGAAKAAVTGKPRRRVDGVLTAEWIEYEIRSPGLNPETMRRQLFDLLGPAARSATKVPSLKLNEQQRLERAFTFLGETEILPLACQLSPAFVEHLLAMKLLANREILPNLLTTNDLAKRKDLTDQLEKITPLPGMLYSLALARQSWSGLGGNVYLGRPNVFSYHSYPRPDGNDGLALCRGFDIVANDVAVRSRPDATAFQLRLTQGVVDTNAEALLMAGCGRVGNTAEAFAMARSQREDWLTVRTVDEPAWRKLKLPNDIRARIEKDLAAGFVVLVPADAVAGEGREFFTWWRVNPETGATLGIAENGWGGTASTERVLIIARISVKIVVGIVCVYLTARQEYQGGQNAYERLRYGIENNTTARTTICIMSTLLGSSGVAMGGVAGGALSLADDLIKLFAIGLAQNWWSI